MERSEPAGEAGFRERARRWLERNAPEFAGTVQHRLHFGTASSAEAYERAEAASARAAKAWQARLYRDGWAGISWPVEFGGGGGGARQEAIFAEECAAAGVSNGPLLVGLAMVAPLLMRHGSPRQKSDHLPPLLRGEHLWCQLFSEPEAGSDLAALRSRAIRDGATWRIDGQKVWTSSARVADRGLLLARTDPRVPKHQGITCFLLDMRARGVTVRPLRQMNGSYHFNEVFLEDVRIPHDQVVAGEGGGWEVARTALTSERAMMAGAGGAKAHALLALARAHGRLDDVTIRRPLARILALDEVLRHMGERLRRAPARGARPEASIMKILAARRAREAGELALLIEGPEGLLNGDGAPEGGEWQQLLLTAPGLRTGGGTDSIHRNFIAERVLGLPREHDPDRDVPFGEHVGRRSQER